MGCEYNLECMDYNSEASSDCNTSPSTCAIYNLYRKKTGKALERHMGEPTHVDKTLGVLMYIGYGIVGPVIRIIEDYPNFLDDELRPSSEPTMNLDYFVKKAHEILSPIRGNLDGIEGNMLQLNKLPGVY